MKRRLLFIPLLAIVLATIAWLGRAHYSLAELAQREVELRQVILIHPARSWCIGFAVYFLLALVPGTRGKAVVYGWLFGFWQALILVNVALTAAAMTAFFASRYVASEFVEGRYAKQLIWANRELEREGAWYVILLRVLPVPYSLTNYLMGATKVDPRTFWWATHVGLLPSNVAFVFVGSQLPSLAEIADRGLLALFSWELAIGVGVLSVLPFVIHWLVRRFQTQPIPAGITQSARVP